MYRTFCNIIDGNDKELFDYCTQICMDAKAMYNTANYYIRNTMTGIKKEEKNLTSNEKEVLNTVMTSLTSYNQRAPKHSSKTKKENKKLNFPSKDNWFLGYIQLNAIFSESNNVDYRNMCSQIAQKMIKKCVVSWDSYFASLKDYKESPSKYKAMPHIPKYLESSMTTVALTNQTFSTKKNEKGEYTINFPKDKNKNRVSYNLGKMSSYIPSGKITKIESIRQKRHLFYNKAKTHIIGTKTVLL